MSQTVIVGEESYTARASNIQTKNVAEGGFASVTFDVKRKLDQSLFDTFTDVYVFDPETGEQTGGGRLLEQGRNDDGTWQVTCLGEGLASMQDITTPIFYVDQDLTHWVQLGRTTKRIQSSVSQYPGYDNDVLFIDLTEGVTVAVGTGLTMVNRLALLTGQSFGGVGYLLKSGITTSNWQTRLSAMNSSLSGGDISIQVNGWNTTLSASRIKRTTSADFASGTRPILRLIWERISTTLASTEDTWSAVRDIIVRAQIYGTDGNLLTTGYTNEYILPHEVITDWVVRHCPRLDVEAGEISTVSTEQIDQMTYLDGVHGMQLAQDVREREPALTWQVWEKGDNDRWPFYYRPLSTEIQYEASTTDGFNAPSPSSEIYNQVTVTGKNTAGRDTNLTLTNTVASLDAVGLVRKATIPLGSEVWSTAAATKVGNEFLAEHEFPPNAGTITIARPIYDNLSGRWIKPCNIRSGGLMRVRGIQPTPDTLNTTAPDGVTVFRVVSATFDNDTNSTVCELDAYTLDDARAIANLSRARTRR